MGELADRLAATMGSRRQPAPYQWTSHRPVVPPGGRAFGRPGNRQALNRGASRHNGSMTGTDVVNVPAQETERLRKGSSPSTTVSRTAGAGKSVIGINWDEPI